VVGSAVAIALAGAPAGAVCVGDCGGNGAVTINELIIGVNIALDLRPVADCPSFACTGGNTVPINCLIQGVNNALGMCPVEDTPTATPSTAEDTPTSTPSTAEDTPTSTPTTAEAPTFTPTIGEDTPTATPVGTVAATATATPVETTPVGQDTPTATPTVEGANTPTATTSVECPLAEGRYTLTQVDGGVLQVASIGGPPPPGAIGFPFPSGGAVVQDVGPGDANCVHETVVPGNGGFSAPVFCIPGLNFSVQVTQNGCGVGRIDSNGGSDYTVTELGDTSDNSTCNLPAVGCPPGPPSTMQADRDASLRVDITVGNAAADTCAGGGTANAITVIPVMTQTWLAADFSCPDVDGVFEPGTDTSILLIDQNLDFTTDVSTSSWSDIDGDGCSLAGSGPAGGFTRTGVCIDTAAMTVTTAATGTISSDGAPLFDLSFATLLPNTISGPTASGGATCDTPPVVNFTGTATRCIE
jgi:hypothetical protein